MHHLPDGHPRALEVLSLDGGRRVGAASGLGVVGTAAIPMYKEADSCNRCGYREGPTTLPFTDRQTKKHNAECVCLCIQLDACTVRIYGYTYICIRYACKMYTQRREMRQTELHGFMCILETLE